MDGTIALDDVVQPINISHGYNEENISLVNNAGELPEGFYWLEVTNEKGLKKYLRFHYDDTPT